MEFDDIQETTGFASGDRFTSPDDVRACFVRAQLRACSPEWDGEFPAQDTLDQMAEIVIAHRWHCLF